jgi:hypothetical protein
MKVMNVRLAVAAMVSSQTLACQGTLLSEVYAVQRPVRSSHSGDNPSDPPQPTGGPRWVNLDTVRLSACQDKQTAELHWAPEYTFAFSFDDQRTDGHGNPILLEDDPAKESCTTVADAASIACKTAKDQSQCYEDVGTAEAACEKVHPTQLSEDRALYECLYIEHYSKRAARTYELTGFPIGILGAGGTAAFTGLATRSGASSSDVATFAALGGVSAAITVLGVYLLARASDSWSAYGAANAAISQMKPNDPDGNWALCAAALQAWTTGRAAADSVVSAGGGGGKGGGAGGGGAGGGGGGAAPGGGGPAPAGGGWPTVYPACPSNLVDIPGLAPPRPCKPQVTAAGAPVIPVPPGCPPAVAPPVAAPVAPAPVAPALLVPPGPGHAKQ